MADAPAMLQKLPGLADCQAARDLGARITATSSFASQSASDIASSDAASHADAPDDDGSAHPWRETWRSLHAKTARL
eukprot:8182449-Alexandrium_andersonii.AAC.1